MPNLIVSYASSGDPTTRHMNGDFLLDPAGAVNRAFDEAERLNMGIVFWMPGGWNSEFLTDGFIFKNSKALGTLMNRSTTFNLPVGLYGGLKGPGGELLTMDKLFADTIFDACTYAGATDVYVDALNAKEYSSQALGLSNLARDRKLQLWAEAFSIWRYSSWIPGLNYWRLNTVDARNVPSIAKSEFLLQCDPRLKWVCPAGARMRIWCDEWQWSGAVARYAPGLDPTTDGLLKCMEHWRSAGFDFDLMLGSDKRIEEFVK